MRSLALYFLPMAPSASNPGLQFFLLGERTCTNFANLVDRRHRLFPVPIFHSGSGNEIETRSWWASFGKCGL